MKGHVSLKLLAVASVVLVSACGGKALNGTEVTTQEATPDKLVLSYSGSINPIEKILDNKFIEEAGRLAAEHCKKFDKVASLPDVLTQLCPPSIVFTYKCDGYT